MGFDQQSYTMSFKHPEFLYFLGFLIVPILVHLFQLRRFKKYYFTNVKLLQELSIQTRKSSTLKKYLLLASRLLLLSFLIFAFAQPFFENENTQAADNELVLIVDNSFSNGAETKKGSVLEYNIAAILSALDENRKISLITNDEAYFNTDIKTIRKEVQKITTSALPFDLNAAISRSADEVKGAKDIVVFTDGLSELKSPKSEGNQQLYFHIPKIESEQNIAITNVELTETQEDFYKIAIDLQKFGEGEASTALQVYNGKLAVAKSVVKLNANTQRVSITLPKLPFSGYVQITDNALAYDNTFYFEIAAPQKFKVLLVGETERNVSLRKIFGTTEFDLTETDIRGLDYGVIGKQQLIILNEIPEFTPTLVANLLEAVENGVNLSIVPRETLSAEAYKVILEKLQLSATASAKSKKLVTGITFESELFQGVFEKKIDNFQYPFANPSFTISGRTLPLLTFADGSAFLQAVKLGQGHVFLFNAGLSSPNSNFYQSPLVVVTFDRMATGNNSAGLQQFEIFGEQEKIVDLNLETDQVAHIVNRAEKSYDFIPKQRINGKKLYLNFGEAPTVAGNYDLLFEGKAINIMSFNYKRNESDVSARFDIPSAAKEIDSFEQLLSEFSAARDNSGFWRTLALLAFLFLICEILIQKFVK